MEEDINKTGEEGGGDYHKEAAAATSSIKSLGISYNRSPLVSAIHSSPAKCTGANQHVEKKQFLCELLLLEKKIALFVIGI